MHLHGVSCCLSHLRVLLLHALLRILAPPCSHASRFDPSAGRSATVRPHFDLSDDCWHLHTHLCAVPGPSKRLTHASCRVGVGPGRHRPEDFSGLFPSLGHNRELLGDGVDFVGNVAPTESSVQALRPQISRLRRFAVLGLSNIFACSVQMAQSLSDLTTTQIVKPSLDALYHRLEPWSMRANGRMLRQRWWGITVCGTSSCWPPHRHISGSSTPTSFCDLAHSDGAA